MPADDFIRGLSRDDRACLVVALRSVLEDSDCVDARRLRGEIFEVRADSGGRGFRLLFAHAGEGRVLLAPSRVSGRAKKPNPTAPTALLELAETRLRDWRSRGRV